MTIQRTTTPAAVARRQLLLDRFTETLADAGAPYPDALATRLRDVVDELGFTLPTGIDDTPPPRPDRCATAEQRATHLATIRAALNPQRHATPPTGQPKPSPSGQAVDTPSPDRSTQ